eukprot:4687816-Pyramimonas_sp.AAC.1
MRPMGPHGRCSARRARIIRVGGWLAACAKPRAPRVHQSGGAQGAVLRGAPSGCHLPPRCAGP